MSTGYADAHERCVDALNSMSIRMDAADLRMDALQVVNDEQQACILSHSKDGLSSVNAGAPCPAAWMGHRDLVF